MSEVANEAVPGKVAYTVAEFCAAHGVGKSLVFEEIAAGRLRTKKAGRRTLILAKDAAAWVDALPEGRAVA
jgi:hypothetical protein